eukprot:gnl/TRDRNA2_/TRDRNA2_30679_c0_seq2.p1 gnl/TRDRNA2_/TRDRNA2_30679_c0~~gnl/TRDRNA2_/TRDRNA2_30679_c0_seq2.p1  ORF type:complete len:160 (+),score=16.01 gnl/TRDRNA2_/TRDRNA2_30679_c0_seq2:27-482(+)
MRHQVRVICCSSLTHATRVYPQMRSMATSRDLIREEPHKLLGVAASATLPEIKEAFRREALRWHPDRHEHDSTRDIAAERFRAVTAAYEAMLEALQKRGKFDGTPQLSRQYADPDSPETEDASERAFYEAMGRRRTPEERHREKMFRRGWC